MLCLLHSALVETVDTDVTLVEFCPSSDVDALIRTIGSTCCHVCF